jgi:hypothetical protein
VLLQDWVRFYEEVGGSERSIGQSELASFRGGYWGGENLLRLPGSNGNCAKSSGPTSLSEVIGVFAGGRV